MGILSSTCRMMQTEMVTQLNTSKIRRKHYKGECVLNRYYNSFYFT